MSINVNRFLYVRKRLTIIDKEASSSALKDGCKVKLKKDGQLLIVEIKMWLPTDGQTL